MAIRPALFFLSLNAHAPSRAWAFALVLAWFAGSASAQTLLKGRVVDAQTGEGISSATVYALRNQRGAIADLDGYFQLELKLLPDSLRISSLGYLPHYLTLTISPTGELKISLQAKDSELEAVVIRPGENPAHRLVRAAIANRARNNPNRLPEYKSRSYNKLYITLDASKTHGPDSVKQARIERLTQRQHLFFWETVTERLHRKPYRVKETVVASRVSGFPGLALPLTPTDLQDLSIYEPTLKVLNVEFTSPLHPHALNLYQFLLTDTLLDGRDTVYTVEFRPQGRYSTALNGRMQLHSRTWAVASLEAAAVLPADLLLAANEVHIRQIHRPLTDSTWFPHQLWTDIGLRLPNDRDTLPLLLVARSTIDLVDLAPMLLKRDFDQYVLEVAPDAARMPDSTWERLRGMALTLQEQHTVTELDSLFGENKFFFWLFQQIDRLRTGFVQVGAVDLNLTRILGYTPVDRFRLGAGLRTNERVSRLGHVGGWVGYGFSDEQWKYGGWLTLTPFRKATPALQVGYESELNGLGDDYLAFQTARPLHERSRVNTALRSFFFEPMAYRQTWWVNASLPIAPWTTARIEGRHRDWQLAPLVGERPAFQVREALAQVRFAWREQWIKSPLGEWAIAAPYPIAEVRLTVGEQPAGPSYQKLEASLTQVLGLRRWGRMRVQGNAGSLRGTAPLPALFLFPANGRPSEVADGFTLQTLPISAARVFAARDFATAFAEWEYTNNRFPSATYSPDPIVRAAWAWGNAVQPPSSEATFIQIDDLNQGYYEIGAGINNILPAAWTRQFASLRLLGIGYYVGFDGRAGVGGRWNQAFKLEYSFRF